MDNYFGFAQELLKKERATAGEPYANAELYDLLVGSAHDDQFYVDFAQKQGGRVLDLACGSGRLLPQLLKAGLKVTGLDLSPEMLAQARMKLADDASRVELVVGDMRQFSFDNPFDTIIIPYCSFIYMHSDLDRVAVFRRCYEHLKPGGHLVFDFLAGEVELGEGVPTLALQGIHPLTDEILLSVVQMKGLAPDLRLLNQINYVYPNQSTPPQITVYSSKEAVLVPAHIVKLLTGTDFTVEGIYNNSSLQAYDEGEECLIVARRGG